MGNPDGELSAVSNRTTSSGVIARHGRRLVLGFAVCILLLTTMAVVGCASFVRVAGPAVAPGALFRVSCSEPLIALTIDDGPVPGSTERILNVLRHQQAQATFFLIGERAEAHGDLVQAIVDGGHEIGNHTWLEAPTAPLAAEATATSIADTHEVLSGYADVIWLRPGSAFYDEDVIAVAEEYGYRLVLGDTFPYDTFVKATAFHEWYILHAVRNGSIIVLHNAHGRGERAAETLWHVLPRLREKGYRVLSLSALVAHPSCEGGQSGNDAPGIASAAPDAVPP
jgi:peptidoglycan/xylan/chitin deacetylase (PgdA/CDA1 family)